MKTFTSYFGSLGSLRLLVTGLLLAVTPIAAEAKGYSSGGGRSYSSGGSSSHSSGGGGHSYGSSSHTFSSGGGGRSSGSSSSGGGTHSLSSGSGRSSSSSGGGSTGFSSGRKSYSSGGERTSYSSGKSYSSGSEHTFSPRSSEPFDSNSTRPKKSDSTGSSSPASSPSGMTFDSGASRAAKEAASKRDFTDYKQAQAAKSSAAGDDSSSPRSRTFDPSGNAPPVIPRSTPPTLNGQTTGYGGGNGYSGSFHQYNYYPDPRTYSTRSIRIHNYYSPYYSRPYVYYNDNYSSLFWWWLLDRPLEERAMWTYYHRNDMDPARYQALVYNDMALDQRVRELEQRQVPVDTNYVPQGMDRDLMYSDQYVNRAYHNRPTHNGQIAFWFILIPTAIGVGGFFVWLIFFKRFQTSTA